MKRAMIAVLTMLMAFLFGTAYAQDAASKASPSEGAIRSITIPVVRIELKEGEGRVKTETYCNICHSVDYITMQPKFPRSQWTATVNKMIKTFGAPIPPEDAGTIISYLSAQYGTGN
jgi:sulfite dehydrogenase (cytochrome) subunit B